MTRRILFRLPAPLITGPDSYCTFFPQILQQPFGNLKLVKVHLPGLGQLFFTEAVSVFVFPDFVVFGGGVLTGFLFSWGGFVFPVFGGF